MDADTQKQLRAPFPPEHIGKLPRVTCRACSDNKQQKHCQQHQRTRCAECSNYITTAHIHLDYVGHAAVTDRLLAVDPTWTWEPLAFGPDGLPALDRNGGLWMRLTVAGVTRLGYGHADGKAGADAVKEAISDAIRNSAMRFGVALDLWHKDGPLTVDEPTGQATQRPPAQRQPAEQRSNEQQPDAPPRRDTAADRDAQQPSAGQAASAAAADSASRFLSRKCEQHGYDLAAVAEKFREQYGEPLHAATDPNRITAFAKLLDGMPQHELQEPAAAGAAQ